MAVVLACAVTAIIIVVAAIVLARIVFALPRKRQGGLSTAMPAAADTALGQVAARHVGQTGIYALTGGEEAFAARILLAQMAERSIDAQYYIWHGDLTGMLLLQAMWDAAERGVRVRLLLDDNGIRGLDAHLASLMVHQNVEVRLFNPFVLRHPKFANYLFDFLRLNRRMHNKSFTVDGAVTIVGGRNIGDEYFAAGTTGEFLDLDVFAVGAVVPKVAQSFDRYWASEPVHAAEAFLPHKTNVDLDDRLSVIRRHPRYEIYRAAVAKTQFVDNFLAGALELETVDVALVADDPAKGAGPIRKAGLLTTQLEELLARPRRDIDLLSAYFVPGRRIARSLAALAKRGVRIRILTNSLGATDVVPVHAGYAKYRKPLLRAGITLYELKPGFNSASAGDDLGTVGSSSASLHAKTFAIDGERMFIGSFNLDPRSALLNTEMGFLMTSARLAQGLRDQFDGDIPIGAYLVELTADNRLVWIEGHRSGPAVRMTTEPHSTWLKRLGVSAIERLPVEWLL